MFSDRLTSPQIHALVTHGEDVKRAADLLESILSEHRHISYQAKRLCERATNGQGRYINAAEVVGVFASFLRVCSVLGPNSQDALRSDLECVIDRMGLTEVVTRRADATPARTRKASGLTLIP